jgi:hypothetical protein
MSNETVIFFKNRLVNKYLFSYLLFMGEEEHRTTSQGHWDE